MHNFNEKHPHVIENVECRCKICEESILKSQKGQDADAIIHIGRLKSICKFKEKQVADTLVPKRASATENIKPVQIQQLPQKSICNSEYQGIADTSATRKVNPSSLYLFQSRYITKQEKTMQSSELESGLPDEAEQECIVFSCLEVVVN